MLDDVSETLGTVIVVVVVVAVVVVVVVVVVPASLYSKASKNTPEDMFSAKVLQSSHSMPAIKAVN